jgi:hypothetical protein
MFIAALLIALSAADTVPPPSAQVLNPDFDRATSPWQFFLDGGTGGSLDWSATRGDPALGSAHAGNVWHGARYDAWGQCVSVTPGSFQLDARVAALLQSGNSCEVRVAVVDQPDCNVNASVLLDVRVHNTHNDGNFEALSASGIAPAGSGAAAIFLAHVRTDAASIGASDCWFDHVGFAGDLVFAGSFDP